MKIYSLNKRQKISSTIIFVFVAIAGVYIYWTPTPTLIVHDQVIENGQVVVGQVNLPYPGWVVLRSSKYGIATEIIGRVRIRRGRNKNVGIYVSLAKASPEMEVSVYADNKTPGSFDLDADSPITTKEGGLKRIFFRK